MSAALRAKVAKSVTQVIAEGKSLREVLINFDSIEDKDRALAREITFGTLREYVALKAISEQLLTKSLRKKDTDILSLILIGLYQLYSTRIPDHAVLSETVQAAVKLKKPWAKGLINALLRKALKEKDQLHEQINQNLATKALLPEWLYQKIHSDWPEEADLIAINSRERAPLTLRVNIRHNSRDEYLQRLEEEGIKATKHPLAEQALLLEKSTNITKLPGYTDGDFAIQDSAAQMAAQLIEVKPEQRILDACAAPGGKTAHILELTDNKATVIALDNAPLRLERLTENLERLKLKAETITADAIDTKQWHKGEQFDRILCDAPCSALGILRRHPDIAILRRESDISVLNDIQKQLLNALWQVLKPGGVLLYATCSILKSENEQQIKRFLETNKDAKLEETIPENASDSMKNRNSLGWQILPGELNMDGFYYAKLKKSET